MTLSTSLLGRVAVLALGALLLGSCSKSSPTSSNNNNGNIPSSSNGTMAATFNGTNFVSDTGYNINGNSGTYAVYLKSQGTTTITGWKASDGSWVAIIAKLLGTGSVNLSIGNGSSVTYYSSVAASDWTTAAATTGSIAITKFDTVAHLASGNFSTTAVSTSNPLAGNFSVAGSFTNVPLAGY